MLIIFPSASAVLVVPTAHCDHVSMPTLYLDALPLCRAASVTLDHTRGSEQNILYASHRQKYVRTLVG